MSKSFNLFLILTFIQILPSISSGGESSSHGYNRELTLELIKDYGSESLRNEYDHYEQCFRLTKDVPKERYFDVINEALRYKIMNEMTFKESGKMNEGECSICHVKFEKGDNIQLNKCGHFFHWECIKGWFVTSRDENHNMCPYRCSEIELILHPEIVKLNEKLKSSAIGGLDIEKEIASKRD
uniref:RING-type domain-containing protein n=1 Tax=Meloidogyne javanica TaxID=6303 RepID=A0A915M3I1_MELJA